VQRLHSLVIRCTDTDKFEMIKKISSFTNTALVDDVSYRTSICWHLIYLLALHSDSF
jgi:hypothetical protein